MKNKSWTRKQIEQHIEAGKILGLIKDEFAQFLKKENHGAKPALIEYECVQFIKKLYKKHGLVNDTPKESCIVAFNQNTNQVHYFASPTKHLSLTTNTLVLLDIWARLNESEAPYADATFMFYVKSKIKDQKAKKELQQIQKTWEILLKARDNAIEHIRKEVKKGNMPRGLDIDRIAHDTIGENGLGQGIKHTVGHSLGLNSPHGLLPGINWKEYKPILEQVGYTIEPGIYLETFGLRTEIDFYVDKAKGVIITTPLQRDIEIIE